MAQRYYKSSAPDVLAAVLKFEVEVLALRAAADRFAEAFGGSRVVGADLHHVSFAGIRFRPQKSTDLFTAADSDRGDVQRPRERLKSPIKQELKEPHKLLKAEWQTKWDECFPGGTSVSREAVNGAIGFDWGYSLFTGGAYLVFEYGGTVYATVSQELHDHMVEITGSEFEQALSEAKATQGGKA